MPIVSAETFQVFKSRAALGSTDGGDSGKSKLGAGMSGINLFDFGGKDEKKKGLRGNETGLWLDLRLKQRPSVFPKMIQMVHRYSAVVL